MEACGSSHHWSSELQALGHAVRLMPPAYVALTQACTIGSARKLRADHGAPPRYRKPPPPGESGEFNHAAMRLARYSSSQPAVLRRRRMESLPGALRVRL